MNEKFKQRLLGLIVVLILLFGLTWLLPRKADNGDGSTPSITLPLAGVTTDGSNGETKADDPGDAERAALLPPDAREPAHEAAHETADAPAAASTDQQERTPDSESKMLRAIAADKPAARPAIAVKPRQNPPPAVIVKADKTVPSSAVSKTDRLEPFQPAMGEKPKPESMAQAAGASAQNAPPPPVSAAAAKAAQATPDAGIWYVQIGSFADQRNAQTTLSLLQNVGYRGEATAGTAANGGSVYRVRLGPFPNEATARAAQDKVAHQGYPQSRAVMETSHGR